jgi:hypothetical protein
MDNLGIKFLRIIKQVNLCFNNLKMILTLPKNNNKDDFAGIFVVSRNDCVYL